MRIGIDLGGTKIEGIALDSAGNCLARSRRTTPSGDYQGTLNTITQLIEEIETATGTKGSIGVGTPGSLSPTNNLIRNANSVCLNGQPLLQDLEMRLNRAVRMANDADCFTLSEAVDGAGKDAHSVFGVIVGTGTGGGIVIDGSLVRGPNAVAGEWGHNPPPWPELDELPGPECYCGKRGCIETWLSGPGLSQDFKRQTEQVADAKQIAALAVAGDSGAEEVLSRYETRMARGLASIINILDPEVIVLGGGLSKLKQLYENIPRRWVEYVFSDCITTRLLPPLHGDASGVRGAAWLWPK